jgi:O-antigen ligase
VTRRKIFYKRYQLSILGLVIGLVAGLSIYVATAERTPRSLQRLANMVEGGEFQGTAASRLELYEDALRFWPDAPLLGHGAGSWPILNDFPDRLTTPHNIFLEVAVESGVVGLILLVALLVVALRPVSIDRLRNDPLALCALMIFVWAFLKANLGPDIAENRFMFLLLGVLTALPWRGGAPSIASLARAPLRPAAPVALSMTRHSGSSRARQAAAQRIR